MCKEYKHIIVENLILKKIDGEKIYWPNKNIVKLLVNYWIFFLIFYLNLIDNFIKVFKKLILYYLVLLECIRSLISSIIMKYF